MEMAKASFQPTSHGGAWYPGSVSIQLLCYLHQSSTTGMQRLLVYSCSVMLCTCWHLYCASCSFEVVKVNDTMFLGLESDIGNATAYTDLRYFELQQKKVLIDGGQGFFVVYFSCRLLHRHYTIHHM